MSEKYDHRAIESKWQKRWDGERVFSVTTPGATPPTDRRGVYVLDMFPYPSGDGLHVGHPEGYTATDIYSRYLRMKGKTVLHPMGWDAFGLPAENAAIKKGIHPRLVTEQNVKNFKRQIQSIGFSYDWTREVNTTDPEYYRWTQWIFLQLFNQGLAYEKEMAIWWCPKDKTGLANEEVVDGKCERCGTAVEKKMLKQWMLKITAYAERLISGLDNLDWPENIKALQRNWIGRSEGAEVKFEILSSKRRVALIVHGCPPRPDHKSEMSRHFYPWLIEKLTRLGYEVVAPNITEADKPEYKHWTQVIEKSLGKNELDESTLVIGVSCGGSFVARYLAEKKTSVGRLLLIAPGCIADPNDPDLEVMKKFYDFTFAPEIAKKTTVVYSSNDLERRIEGAKRFIDGLKAKSLVLDKRGHFTEKDGVKSIPEIVDFLKQEQPVTVFTTRPDTLFGATYLVLSPEHELVAKITTLKQKKAVEKYVKSVAAKSDLERTSLEKEKTGVFTGAYAINPANQEKIPVWIADYVLASYGTGAIMAVPAHDERDHEFATKFSLPIRKVIKPPSVMGPDSLVLAVMNAGGMGHLSGDLESGCWTGEGTIVNSGGFDGLPSEQGREKIVAELQSKGMATSKVQYKLRDWVFSRQRYWGEPIPLVHCQKCGVVPVPEDQLPVLLPDVEKYEPTGTGESPLAAIDEWVNTTCPNCDGPAKRETNTMPQWAGSCWYYLRFCDPQNTNEFASADALKAWLPVDLYVGGAEHAVLHLLYARFWHMVLYDIGAIPKTNDAGRSMAEPFLKLKNQGLILGPDGEKMSKSRGNVINPDEIIEKFGADTLRMYEMFMGPFEDAKPWDTNGIVGVHRFLKKVTENIGNPEFAFEPQENDRWHKYVEKVTHGIENFRFNTCVSDLMKWVNEWGMGLRGLSVRGESPRGPWKLSQKEFEVFLKLLSPFAPHLAEELWSRLGHETLIATEPWPDFDPALLQEENVTIAVQVNGKLRATLSAPTGSNESVVRELAEAAENVKKFLPGKPKKVIFVPDKLINFVI